MKAEKLIAVIICAFACGGSAQASGVDYIVAHVVKLQRGYLEYAAGSVYVDLDGVGLQVDKPRKWSGRVFVVGIPGISSIDYARETKANPSLKVTWADFVVGAVLRVGVKKEVLVRVLSNQGAAADPLNIIYYYDLIAVEKTGDRGPG